MKVVHIITCLNVGGAESMLYKLLCATDPSVCDCVVISLTNKGTFGPRIETLGIPVLILNLEPGKYSIKGLFSLMAILRTLKPDIVVGWMYHGVVAASLASLFSRVRFNTIWNIRHALEDLKSERFLTQLLIRFSAILSVHPKKIIFNSNMSMKHHCALGYRTKPSLVIPNGFDLKKFKPNSQAKQKLYDQLSLPQDSILIGIIGRYHQAKGYKYFIAAANMVAAQKQNAHFLLIGRGVNQDNESLRTWIGEANYSDRFHLLGEKKEVNKIISALDVLVNASTTESFANIIGEAMSCGVPCVATDVGDAKIIINDCGHIVPARNASALSEAVLAVLSWSPKEVLKNGVRARARIAQKYTIDVINEQYQQLFVSLMKGC